MSLSVPTTSLNLTVTQKATSGGIDSGAAAGGVFNGKGNDFLDPNKILNNVNGFSGGVGTITSHTPNSQVAFLNPFGQNAESTAILGGTNSGINKIMNGAFNINFTLPFINTPGGLVPDLGINPDPTKIVLATTAFSNGVQAPAGVIDPRNSNPLIWHNPSASEILLGGLTGQAGVLGGGVSFPPFNPFPTQGVVGFPSNPFGGSLQTGGFLPGTGFSGGFGIPQAMPFGGSFSQPQLTGIGIGIQAAMFPVFGQARPQAQPFVIPQMQIPVTQIPQFTQPFSLPATSQVQQYPSLVNTMSLLNDITGLMSHTMRQLVRMDASSASYSSSSVPAPVAYGGQNGGALYY